MSYVLRFYGPNGLQLHLGGPMYAYVGRVNNLLALKQRQMDGWNVP